MPVLQMQSSRKLKAVHLEQRETGSSRTACTVDSLAGDVALAIRSLCSRRQNPITSEFFTHHCAIVVVITINFIFALDFAGRCGVEASSYVTARFAGSHGFFNIIAHIVNNPCGANNLTCWLCAVGYGNSRERGWCADFRAFSTPGSTAETEHSEQKKQQGLAHDMFVVSSNAFSFFNRFSGRLEDRYSRDWSCTQSFLYL